VGNYEIIAVTAELYWWHLASVSLHYR